MNRPAIAEEIPQIIPYLDAGVPFRLKVTANTAKLETAGGRAIIRLSGQDYDKRELSFIRSVKNAVKKSGKAPDRKYSPRDIPYFWFDRNKCRPGTVATDCVELDVTAAYFHAAVKLGYLPESFIEKAGKVSKLARLVALGSLATHADVYEFDGRNLAYKGDTQPDTAPAWYHICHEFAQAMMDVQAMQGNIFFFWVDAFFVPATQADAVEFILTEIYGYPVKRKPLQKIEVQNINNIRQIIVTDAEGQRIFFPPVENLRTKMQRAIIV